MSASATVAPLDSTIFGDDYSGTAPERGKPISNDLKSVAPEENRPDVLLETKNAMKHLTQAVDGLNLYEKKLLRLRGVEI
jgi:hypothetical protein